MSRNRDGIHLVCFDIGGVLIRCVAGWRDACRRVGLPPFTAEPNPEQRARIQEASRHFESGGCTPEQFAERLQDDLGQPAEKIRAALDTWLLELYPGIDAMLDHLHRTSLRTAVLSNTNPVHWRMIRHDGDRFAPLSTIHHHFASHLIGVCKPDTAIYQHVERELEVDPHGILFFDDRRENVDAAHARGWWAEWIDPTANTAEQIEDHLAHYHLL